MTTASPEAAAPESRARHAALEWWERLADPRKGNPGALAQLRRCRSTVEALRVREAINLAVRLGAARSESDAPDRYVRAAVDLSRVLAHVKKHEPARHPMQAAGWKSFAGDRRESDVPPDERPVLSEVRFRRLLQTGPGEEQVAAFVRLVALLDGTVNVESLARDFLVWTHPAVGDRVREHWAFFYFGAGAAVPAPTETDPEDES